MLSSHPVCWGLYIQQLDTAKMLCFSVSHLLCNVENVTAAVMALSEPLYQVLWIETTKVVKCMSK